MPRALIVEDHADTLEMMASLVEREGFEVSTADSLSRARELIDEEHPAVVLLDLLLPDGDGMDLVDALEQEPVDLPVRPEVVLVTGNASLDTAVAALRMGVADYLTKPVDVQRLRAVLANVAKTRALRDEVESLRRELRDVGRFGQLVGISEPMQRVYDRISRVAPTTAPVLITGESGTGKELAASAIHAASARSKGPFRALNCGAVAGNLIESELFGHERGAFTGADKRHRGYFEQATDGTLFLDEIAEMPAALQVRLLRVLETKTLTRVGGEETIEVNARLIAATNRDLDEALREGTLREDLYYRLNVFGIELPPLRSRDDDLTLLAQHFLDHLNKEQNTAKRLSEPAIELLRAHSWPGNVRELKNAIHGAFILADEVLESKLLPEEVFRDSPFVGLSGAHLDVRVGMSVADAEKRLILATLERCDGNKTKAAETLGVSVKTLYNRLDRYRQEAQEAAEEEEGPVATEAAS